MTQQDTDIVISQHEVSHGSVMSYTIGFILSIVLTIIPFLLVINELIWGWAMVFTLMGFAVLQLIVQIVFFLHLGRESRPRWNLQVFLFMLLVVFIIAVGTLWIMDNLHYNMQPFEVEEYIFEEEAIRPEQSY